MLIGWLTAAFALVLLFFVVSPTGRPFFLGSGSCTASRRSVDDTVERVDEEFLNS